MLYRQVAIAICDNNKVLYTELLCHNNDYIIMKWLKLDNCIERHS